MHLFLFYPRHPHKRLCAGHRLRFDIELKNSIPAKRAVCQYPVFNTPAASCGCGAIQDEGKTYLGHDGIFITEEEYSEFVRTEIVVNAATHRDYGIKGTDIQIKMFDDRLEVDSPGTFAGMVKKENWRRLVCLILCSITIHSF